MIGRRGFVALFLSVAMVVPSSSRAGRSGIVHAAGNAFADQAGPYLAVGTSLFWAAWGYLHDRERLEQNLACVAGQLDLQPGCPGRTARVDFIRVLLVVGPSDGWHDRSVSDEDVYRSDVLTGLSDLAYGKYGLRVEWTIFGSIDSTPTAAERERLVSFVADSLASRAHAVQFYEVANEATLNGFPGEEGKRELWQLARVLRKRTPNLVALTSPQGEDARAYYRGSPATLATIHLSRDVEGPGGRFEPIRNACEPGHATSTPWVSNEPIGPQSSVAADDDPVRLTLAAVYTWLCGGAAYVLHTGAGVRGGGEVDRDGGRRANVWEVAHLAEILRGIGAARAALPVNLPNFRRLDSTSPIHPFGAPALGTELRTRDHETDALDIPCAIAEDGQLMCVPIDITHPTRLVARRAVTFDVRTVTTGAVREQVTLDAGESYTLAPAIGVLLAGRAR